jgi:hypothetical protein
VMWWNAGSDVGFSSFVARAMRCKVPAYIDFIFSASMLGVSLSVSEDEKRVVFL